MSAVYEEVYGLLVPMAGGRLILPRAAVVEVMGYNAPTDRPTGAPDWLMGWCNWQGGRIPLISFEAACGQPLPDYKARTRIAVVQAISGLLDPPAFAIATQGYPYLLRVNRGVLKLDDSTEPIPAQMLTRLRMANERPGVPDLELLERMIAQALGIPIPEEQAEAVEVMPDEPTLLGAGQPIEMPAVADDAVRFDDDSAAPIDEAALESALDDATADATFDATVPTPGVEQPDPDFIGDDLTIEGIEVDEGDPK